jgi:cysteinyl-tRNA synthetase
MSKSLGNVIYVKDLENKVDGMILRSLIVFSPYRSIIQYSEELLNQYKKEYEKWQRTYKMCLYELQYIGLLSDKIDEDDISKFKEYMNQDFNVQNVLTLITTIVKEMNTLLRSKDFDKLSIKLNTFITILDVLGINLFVDKLDDEKCNVYKLWNEARNNKDFEAADKYRNQLVEWNVL